MEALALVYVEPSYIRVVTCLHENSMYPFVFQVPFVLCFFFFLFCFNQEHFSNVACATLRLEQKSSVVFS